MKEAGCLLSTGGVDYGPIYTFTFASPAAMQKWLTDPSNYPSDVQGGYLITGRAWVVGAADSSVVASHIHSLVGGTVRRAGV
jgi:hypothetical protein